MSETQTLDEKRALVARLLLERHRQQFPTLGRFTYLNFGAQGTLPTPAREAIGQSLRRLDELVPYSTDAILERRQELARARTTLAGELGIEGRCLALLVGLPLDGKSASLLCRRSLRSTLLIQNLARWPATPPAVLQHMFRQPVVMRSTVLKNQILRHPNVPSDLKRSSV